MTIGLAFAIGASVMWGLTYTLDQKVMGGVSPGLLLFITSCVSSVLFAPIYLKSSSLKVLTEMNLGSASILALTVFTTITANFLILMSIKSLGASTASILEISYPFFVLLFSYLILGSEVNLFFFLGAILISVGSFLIVHFSGTH